ncbi:Hypothetical predicted protein [Mytilus galloprovincialis]|uniref:DDE Tnp4 domain-containing protein n=1 Tax=Mytilus galloprovincialis TaxID=29158 RepID=A0A8B6HKC6_MYTGA|nr:Hypothetical predicted protein [Mytilus galloprovincialis]
MLFMHLKMQTPPPLPYLLDEQNFAFLLLVTQYDFYRRKLRMPLPFYNFSIRSRILENENQDLLVIKDVYGTLISRPYDFWRISGETVQSFEELFVLILPRVRGLRNGQRNVNLRNRLLLTLVWLRQYPTYPILSLIFGICNTLVGSIVNTMWLILWEALIVWPDVNSWQQKIGKWSEMPNVLASIDGTSHEILIPSTEPQEEFYSGHRKYHCFHTQVIIDNEKNICYIHGGFLGHDNDAFAYQQIKPIGPGLELDFPNNCFILADSIYPNNIPLVTPYKSLEILRQPQQERRRRRKFNCMHRKRRVYVEHVIKELKTFKVIGSLYRHPRWEMASIVELCAALSKRRADNIGENYPN